MVDCLNVDGCGVDLSISPAGNLRADLVIAALPCNALSCIPGQGLFMTEDESLVQAGTSNPTTGWFGGVPFDLFDLPVGLPLLVAYSGTLGVPDVFVNESDCRYANLIYCLTGREVFCSPLDGGFYRVTTVAKINGFGFFPIMSMTVDLRWDSAVTNHLDSRPQGSSVAGRLIPPGGQVTYEFQTYLVNLGTTQPLVFVESPGFTFAFFSTLN